ncbi:MAG: hypothetical protein LC114_04320, partial [Bryobacterales bacterium]|nr:hypothetical protein [Bryobacterales bacterium]
MIQPKFTIHREVVYSHHRNGWGYVINAIKPLLREDGEGVLLDCSVERSFVRDLEQGLSEGWLPHIKPWVGFVHVPPDVPQWAEWWKSPRELRKLDVWRRSLGHCLGLIAFSEWMAEWLRLEFRVPVLAVKHPVPPAPLKFRWDKFEHESHCGVVQVGHWLRRISSIHHLPVASSRKKLLIPLDETQVTRYYRTVEAERQVSGAPPLSQWDCTVVERLSNDDYDELLSSHAVFLDLAGAVAVNTLLECIMRHTPILVNPYPSIVEYLGPDYPLYN